MVSGSTIPLIQSDGVQLSRSLVPSSILRAPPWPLRASAPSELNAELFLAHLTKLGSAVSLRARWGPQIEDSTRLNLKYVLLRSAARPPHDLYLNQEDHCDGVTDSIHAEMQRLKEEWTMDGHSTGAENS